VIQIGLQLITRLDNLHEQGFLHMDLKPENILIGSDNYGDKESSKLYLIDFGLS
jgi:serine/threonine protein kinase